MFKTLKNNGEIISFLDGNDVRESIEKVVENMQGISNCCGYPIYMDRCSKCKEGCDTEIPGNEVKKEPYQIVLEQMNFVQKEIDKELNK